MLLSVGKDMFGKHNNFLNDIIIRYNNRFGHTIYGDVQTKRSLIGF